VIAGRIEAPSDLDCYSLVLKKGEKITFEVIARRQMSNLDAFLRILNEQGQPLREDDDGVFGRLVYADTFLESWEAPADGKYIVEIRDGLLRGGTGFEYALKVTRSEPYYLLQTDSDKTQLTPGTYGSIFARIVRKNGFAGEVQLHIDGLPEGVTATCGKILKGKNPDGCINLYADPNLKPTTANVRIWGTVIPDDQPVGQSATPASTGQPVVEAVSMNVPVDNYQEYYSPGGGRGLYPVETHTVSVGTSGDLLAVNLSDTEIRLKPGESRKIAITLQRAKEINANVTLDLMNRHLEQAFTNCLPDGVTIDGSQSKTLLTGSDCEGYITLKAEKGSASAERQVCAVLASFSINFVMKATYSSPTLFVTVEKETVEK
jgi:hypothetical protein